MGVLATVDKLGLPHTRTIAIREINNKGALFFTQQGSEKVTHLKNNSNVSLTIVLPNKKRQVSLQGEAEALSETENSEYWKTYDKISRIRFMVYGGDSGKIIPNNDALDKQLREAMKKYSPALLEQRPKAYVGYRINPVVIKMYQLNDEKISDSYLINKTGESWHLQRVSP